MQNYRFVKDHGSHFEIHDKRDGSSFKVAKKGLSKKNLDAVTGMQHLDDGGFPDGGAAPDDGTDAGGGSDGSGGNYTPAFGTDPMGAFQAPASANPITPMDDSISMDTTPSNPVTPMGDAVDMPPAANVPAPVNSQPGQTYATPDQAPPQTPGTLPAPQQSPQSQAGSNVAQIPAMAPVQMPAFPAPPAGVSTKPLEKADQEEKDALQQGVQLAQQKGSAEKTLQDQLAVAEQQRQTDMQTALKAEQARGDQFRQAVANGKIDPQRYWKSLGTGGQIGNILLAAIGGFASGWTHGKVPNYALQAINDNVDKDIEAQKAEMTKNMDLAKMSDEQLSALRTQFDQKKIDLLQLSKIKLDSVAAQYGGANAQAAAAQLSAGIDKELAKTQISVAQQSANSKFQYNMAKFNYQAQQVQAQKAQGAQDTLMQMLQGRPFNPGLQVLLPEKYKSQTVNVDGGYQRLATNDKAADTYRDVQSSTDRIESLIREARQLGSTGYGTKGAARAEQIQAELQTEWGKVAGLSRYTDLEDKKYQSIIGNIGAWNQDRQNSRLDGVQSALTQVKLSAQKNLLLGGVGVGSPGGSTFQPKTASDY